MSHRSKNQRQNYRVMMEPIDVFRLRQLAAAESIRLGRGISWQDILRQVVKATLANANNQP